MNVNRLIYRKLVLFRCLFQKNSGILISYPKSGRTWLRLMLDDLNCHLTVSHSGSEISKGLPLSDIPTPNLDSSLPALFLFRNPIDVVVSSWFQYCYRIDSSLKISLKDFIRHPLYGIDKIVKFNLMYLEHVPSNSVKFACINYEVLVTHPALCLEQILRFYGSSKSVSRKNVLSVSNKYSFNNMKSIERRKVNLYGVSFLGTVGGNPAEPESFKVRKGVVCGYREYLDNKDIDFCHQVMSSCHYSSRLQNISCHLLPLDPLVNSSF